MAAPSRSQDEVDVDRLSALLEQMEERPTNVALIKEQISLMQKLGMAAEVSDATMRLASLVMLSEDQWLSYIDQLVQGSPRPLTLEGFVDILERFEQAEKDRLSLTILLRHVEFILGCANNAAGLSSTEETTLHTDDDVQAYLTDDVVRDMLRATVGKGNGLLSESHLLWQPWLDWEISKKDYVDAVFQERMSIPHAALDATQSAYSAFLNQHQPMQYEAKMVQLTEVAQGAKVKWSVEKRFGKTREDLELLLVSNPETYTAYIDWETDPRAKNPRSARAPSTDLHLTRSIFERAIAFYGKAAAAAESALLLLPKPSKKGKAKEDDGTRATAESTWTAYRAAEAGIWARYTAWDDDVEVKRRAVRASPESGKLWRGLMQSMEQMGSDGAQLALVFETALGLGQIDQPADIAELYIGRAAAMIRAEVDGDPHPILSLAASGFEAIMQVNKAGDASLKLEKFILEWAETKRPDAVESALTLVEKPCKSRSSAYQMVLLAAAAETRRGEYAKARAIYEAAISRTDLDWPEAVYDAFLQFETIQGDLTTLAEATSKIEIEQQKVARRREKANQEQMQQYYAAAEEIAQPAVVETTDVAKPDSNETKDVTDDSHFKRDRENTTILVNGLADDTTKADLESWFIDIGHIREIVLMPGNTAATVEFRFADAVPTALARDGKKLGGRVVAISMLWRSTLFVTNYPPHTDDAALRQMFGQYGTILGDIRFPSLKYANSRRFCYITMDSPASAQECLVLNGMNLDGLSMVVLISDPTAKTKRSDADGSAERTLFVGGLTGKTTEGEVRHLLAEHGPVLQVKLGWDPSKRECKGFAFVEMESEAAAKSACALSGTKRLGKTLKVVLSDRNHRTKKPDTTTVAGAKAAADKRERTIRLHNLPEGTQEGLLQQALEKIAPVQRLEVFAAQNEAIAELASQADVGKILLRQEPFTFNGATISISQQTRRPPPAKSGKAAPEATVLSFAPRVAAARRGGKVLGKARPAPTSQPAPASTGSQDFFRNLVSDTNEDRKRKAGEEGGSDTKRQKP